MNRQGSLFGLKPPEPPSADIRNMPPLERYQGALAFAAIGDALGWPTEFLKPDQIQRAAFSLPIGDFIRWHKMVGGRWWGYRDEIGPGEYSDDTQLSLAVARSLSPNGEFEPNRFAYIELPLWLHYQRGGGRSIKIAARNLLRRRADWRSNFYRQGGLDYRQAGANGAAMRNLPIALASLGDQRRLIRDSFLNAIITHGHPRAIIGTILFGLSVHYALVQRDGAPFGMIEYLREGIDNLGRAVVDEGQVRDWIRTWEHRGKAGTGSFRALWAKTREEADGYLSATREFLGRPTQEYYRLVGALTPATKGSGLGTVCAAILLFLRDKYAPEERMVEAVNLLGSDTDTIALFLGALLGARFGLAVVPQHLLDRIQDRGYLLKTAARLHAIAAGEPSEHTVVAKPLDQQEALLRILAWEVGLHEMFWDAVGVGGSVVHPTLGRGTIMGKDTHRIGRAGYVARLISIGFDCGQSCVFHSLVEHDRRVTESLGIEVEKALGY